MEFWVDISSRAWSFILYLRWSSDWGTQKALILCLFLHILLKLWKFWLFSIWLILAWIWVIPICLLGVWGFKIILPPIFSPCVGLKEEWLIFLFIYWFWVSKFLVCARTRNSVIGIHLRIFRTFGHKRWNYSFLIWYLKAISSWARNTSVW